MADTQQAFSDHTMNRKTYDNVREAWKVTPVAGPGLSDNGTVGLDTTVTTSPELILAANMSREVGVMLFNNSRDTIYINFATWATATNGFPLHYRGTLILDTTKAIWAQTVSGTSTLHYIEI